jgi:copper chaperone CopZ
MKHYLFAIIWLFSAKAGFAQFISAEISITGLTCSMCSYSVEKQLRQLDFVQDIKMELNSNTATVTFVPGKKVIIEQLSKKVSDAGFSVGALYATFNFNGIEPKDGTWFSYEGDTYHFVGDRPYHNLSGQYKLRFVDKSFMSKKEYYQWKPKIDAAAEIENNTGHFYNITF